VRQHREEFILPLVFFGDSVFVPLAFGDVAKNFGESSQRSVRIGNFRSIDGQGGLVNAAI
jgi:hypothetical protein